MVELVSDNSKWLASKDSPPKLFVNADPGAILIGRAREHCRSWPNHEFPYHQDHTLEVRGGLSYGMLFQVGLVPRLIPDLSDSCRWFEAHQTTSSRP
jgi:hypothetical protein